MVTRWGRTNRAEIDLAEGRIMGEVMCEHKADDDATDAISGTQKGVVRPHQTGETVFKSILSEDIDWKPFPAFPPSVRLATVVGMPSQPGPYTIRVKVPHGVKL